MAIEMLLALKAWLKDYKMPFWSRIHVHVPESWAKMCNDFRGTNKLHAGLLNALDELTSKLTKLIETQTLDEFKESMANFIDDYIEEKIVYAQEAMVKNGLSLLKGKKSTVMIFGENVTMERLFEEAHKEGYKFNVIVVDTCPEFSGRDTVQRLSNAGIKCKYTLLQGCCALMSQTTLVFIGASYVLGNGGVVGSSGTSMLSYVALQHRVPVVAFCESYKFTMRVNIDQFKGNEVGDPRDITHNYLSQN